MGSPSRNVQDHPPRLSEDRLNLPQPHSPSLPTHCTAPGNRECAHFAREFCSFLARTYAERPLKVTEDRVDSIVDLYLEQVGGKDFGEIMDRLARDYPRERDICVEVAREATVDTSRGRLKHLVGYQLIEVQESRVVLTMELFRKWILEWL